MKINLHEYVRELEYWIKAFEPYVDRASIGHLRDTHESMSSKMNKKAEFEWATSRPITLAISTEYDRAEGQMEPVHVSWRFRACFSPDPEDKSKRPLWDVLRLNTELEVHRQNPEMLLFRFHHDMKDKDQLGPHAHLQVSESFLEEKVGMRLAVPRFPAVALLPTDCLDMVLSEFFPRKWPKEQSGAFNFDTLRRGQIDRAERFAEALRRDWGNRRKRTPVASLQNCYFPDLRLA
jgi:hypothetical protein